MKSNVNDRVIQSRANLQDVPIEVLETMRDVLLKELGEPRDFNEREAIASLLEDDYDASKRRCLFDPCNPYLAAISCIASAFRSPMVADSVLRDAARHAAEVARRSAERRICEAFAAALEN